MRLILMLLVLAEIFRKACGGGWGNGQMVARLSHRVPFTLGPMPGRGSETLSGVRKDAMIEREAMGSVPLANRQGRTRLLPAFARLNRSLGENNPEDYPFVLSQYS